MTRFTGQAGDTIVEVMVALSVLSVVLLGAFTLTNLNLRSVRDSEEHTEALQLLQGQVEQLRTYLIQNPGAIPGPFCMSNASFGPTPPFVPPNMPPPNCKFSSSATGPTLYGVTITQLGNAPPLTTNTYKLDIQWPSLRGGTDDVHLAYST